MLDSVCTCRLLPLAAGLSQFSLSSSHLALSHLSLSQVIVQRTEAKVDAGASLLQDILKVGAEDDGEFLVPLSNAKAAGIFFFHH